MTDNRTTERLRAMLDERGIEHTDASYKRKVPITVWRSDGATFCFIDDVNQTDLHIENPTTEQAIAATLGRPKAKSHPYGYERDTGAYDCTRCECGCINDISARYCNDCGGEIEIDEYAEKEFYEYNRNSVFVIKHDDGTLEFGGKRYVAATLGKPNATSDQESIVRSFLRKISSNRDWDYLGEHEHALIADLVNDIAATLGSEREKALEKLVQYALDEGYIDEWWYEDARKLGLEARY